VPYALVATTVYASSTTGGTFADTLAANSGDTTAVAAYNDSAGGGARVKEAWAMDSAHACEIQFMYTRPESTHDQSFGLRLQVPALYPAGSSGKAGAHILLPGTNNLPVYKNDTPTIKVTSTASDAVAMTYLTEYDDLPGSQAQFITPQQAWSLRKSNFSNFVNATANATAGLYGTARAINADDDRFHGNTWYAVMGFTVQVPVLSVVMQGPELGSNKIALPGGALELDSTFGFTDLSYKYNQPLVPVFNAANKGNWNIYVVDTAANTAPKIDFNYLELTGQPTFGQ
jgi:hypothetical protein